MARKMIWFWISTAWTWPISRSYYFLNTTPPRATSLRFKTGWWALATRWTASILGGHTTSVPTNKITKPSSNRSAIWSMNWFETIQATFYKKPRTAKWQPLVLPRSLDLWFLSRMWCTPRISRNRYSIRLRHSLLMSFTCFIMKTMTLRLNRIKLPSISCTLSTPKSVMERSQPTWQTLQSIAGILGHEALSQFPLWLRAWTRRTPPMLCLCFRKDSSAWKLQSSTRVFPTTTWSWRVPAWLGCLGAAIQVSS